jgi:hypothetical protein
MVCVWPTMASLSRRRAGRVPVFVCAMMRTVRLDTRRVCIAAARLSGAVSGWSAPPPVRLGVDGHHSTRRRPSRYGSIMRISDQVRNRYLC